jgi:hypothetical protein
VKKVLSNAVYYAALLAGPAVPAAAGSTAPSLGARLGPGVGPRAAGAPPIERDLP